LNVWVLVFVLRIKVVCACASDLQWILSLTLVKVNIHANCSSLSFKGSTILFSESLGLSRSEGHILKVVHSLQWTLVALKTAEIP
jgi:hypothetical protein